MSKIIGIDLGTTNSAFAYMVAGKPEVITNSEGDRTTPSVVAVTKKGDRLVGKVAQRQRVTNPKNTIYGIKRLIGRKFDDKEVQRDLDIMPYKIIKKGNGVAVEMDGKEYTPEEVSAMVLSKIKADAEAVAASLADVALTIGAKASATGTIFGSVNNIQIAEALEKLGHNIDRKLIEVSDAIKEVGDYKAIVNLHKEVVVEVPFTVVAE